MRGSITRAPLAFACVALFAGGCSGMLRVSAGPTIDTLGHVGGEVRVTCGIGPGSIVVPVSIQAGSTPSSTGDRGAIAGGGGFEIGGCTDARVCGQLGVALLGRDVVGDRGPRVDGFGMEGRVAVQYAVRYRHHSGNWFVHVGSDDVIGLGGEIDLGGYPISPHDGGLFFFGASFLVATFLR